MLTREQTESWIDRRYTQLAKVGWEFVHGSQARLSAHIGGYDAQTLPLMTEWSQTDKPVEMSIVLVPPSGDILRLPIRALAYASSALNLIATLRDKHQVKVNINTLRVLAPAHASAYAGGGDLETQLNNAESVRRLVTGYRDAYLPNLGKLTVTVDTGKPITSETEAYLGPRIDDVMSRHPDIASDLLKTASRYHSNGLGENPDELLRRSITYLLTHPPAWGYSQEEFLFERNGNRRINYLPGSELQYLWMITRIKAQTWTPSTDKQIATVVSARQIRAPYLPIIGEGAWGTEPTLQDLITKREVSEGLYLFPTIQQLADPLRKYTGRPELAEIIANLNQIKSDLESGKNRRRLLGLGPTPSLAEVIKASIK